jgi:hypothetical protein
VAKKVNNCLIKLNLLTIQKAKIRGLTLLNYIFIIIEVFPISKAIAE